MVQALGLPFKDLFGPVHLFSDATNILVPAMEKAGVSRLIAVTGFGTGDSRDAIGLLQRVPFRLVFGRAYDDKDAQEMRIRRSRLDWTFVRPGVLTGGSATGRYKVLGRAVLVAEDMKSPRALTWRSSSSSRSTTPPMSGRPSSYRIGRNRVETRA